MALPRILLITSPLGEDALIATALTVTECLGLPYTISVEVLASDAELQASDLLTQAITVTVQQQVDEQLIERHFHGLVSEFHRLGPGPSQQEKYRLVAVPGIWRLGLKQNCRVFQAKTAQQIVNTILGEHEQPTPNWGILPTLQPMPYCTQFNETDLHFVSRLLEEHGMSYYFTHTASAHTLCISATAPGFPTYVGGSVLAAHTSPGFFHLSDWQRLNRARSAAADFKDMDAERSQLPGELTSTSNTQTYADEPAMWAAGKNFRWPGGMSTRPGVESAAVVMGEHETASEAYSAQARDPRFVAGARVAVAVVTEQGAQASAQYVITSVRHQATDASSLRSGSGGTEAYASSLVLVASARTWMPEPRHARPVMAGLYSAVVTGPSGEQIHVDENGRIKVRFRWDHLAPTDDTSSMWVRVMQAAGGAWGGTWFLPRVGDEVLVAFLDGDPDRPVVAGAVYGKDTKPPFLPGTNRAQSGFRSRSYKSNSADDANILRFEDKKGSEEVLLHAQKDLTVEVEHDENRMVQNARTTTIKDSHDTLTVETGNRVATINKGNDTHTIKLGDMTVKAEAGSILIEAMQKITLKVGQNTVVIDQKGITSKGLMITDEAQTMHKTKSPMVEIAADAMIKAQGGIVMIN